MIYDDTNPERFLVRCTRDGRDGPQRGDRHVPVRTAHRQADITARFPREWLSDWREVSQGLEALIGKLRGAGR